MYKKIKTVEQAFALQNEVDINNLPDLSSLPAKFSRGMLALLKLQVIVFVINNDSADEPEWKADFNDNNQQKWYPWYRGGAADGSGSGFSFDDTAFVWTYTGAGGGARLALKDEARAEHMNKYFSDLYKDLWLILE